MSSGLKQGSYQGSAINASQISGVPTGGPTGLLVAFARSTLAAIARLASSPALAGRGAGDKCRCRRFGH